MLFIGCWRIIAVPSLVLTWWVHGKSPEKVIGAERTIGGKSSVGTPSVAEHELGSADGVSFTGYDRATGYIVR